MAFKLALEAHAPCVALLPPECISMSLDDAHPFTHLVNPTSPPPNHLSSTLILLGLEQPAKGVYGSNLSGRPAGIDSVESDPKIAHLL